MSHQPRLELLESRVVLSPTIFTVNSTGSGTSGSGTSGTLPYVISQANANTNTAGSEIEFDSSVFTLSSPQTITLSATLVLSETAGPEVIDGPGAGIVTVSGGGAVRVFEVDSGVTATLSGLTIRGGWTNSFGGGLENYGTVALSDCTISGNSAYRGGGGVWNNGTAALTTCTISGNSGIEGGGVYNFTTGTANLIGCTFSGNYARNSGGGLASYGTATLLDCTISGNTADDAGGGVYDTGSATVADCTISDNTAGSIGDGIDVFLTPATLTGTIVAGNVTSSGGGGNDVNGAIPGSVTGSNNLIGTDGSWGLVNGVNGNIVGVTNPGLAPLGDYGGPTETIALLPGSPAIGAGTAVSGITNDQRGEPLDSPPDIGAFQSQGFTITPVSGSTPQQTTAGTAFANPLAVDITANNPIEPVAGGTVTFTVPSSGASAGLTAGSATIAANGMASVEAADNSIAGAYTVTASAAGSVPGSFQLTNLVSSLVSVYTVNSTSGGFSGSGTSGTLPYVIFLTNADANPSTDGTIIQFDPSVFSSPQTITLGAALGLSETAGPDAIDGPGAKLVTLSGGGAVRVFEVDSGTTATLSGLTISGGSATVGGAGLEIDGTATLTDCTISGNEAGDNGGAVGNDGTTTLTSCTINGNSGGGVYNEGSATLINCTISGNSAGDGVDNDDGTLVLNDCTISGNSSGGLLAEDSTTLTDTIVAGNTSGYNEVPNDITGYVTGTNNLIGIGGAGGLENGASGNIVLASIAALDLAPLGDYGGPTETMALLPGSAAIGAGTTVNGVTDDERGEPLDSPPDIGAFQSQGFTITPVAGGTLQQTTDGTAFADPLTVVVTAKNPLEPVAGGTVTFTDPSSGASAALTADTVTIGPDGSASVIAADDSIAGSYSVIASATGGAPVSFNLTNLVSSLVSDYIVNSTSGGISGSGSSGTLPYVIFLTNADANPSATHAEIDFDPAVFSTPQTIVLGTTLILAEMYGPDVIDGPGAGLVTVSGGGAVGVFVVASGVTATLSGLTISGGSTTGNGGGVLADGPITLTGCVLDGNSSSSEGGGLFAGGAATITNCTFSDNVSSLDGGGLYVNSSVVSLDGCTFSDNSAEYGGGVCNAGGSSLTVVDCTFSGNLASYFGGGVLNNSGGYPRTGPGIVSMNDCVMSGNTAGDEGGGVSNNGGTFTLINCTFSGNSADFGGGLANSYGGQATLTYCTISGNSASAGGGLTSSGVYNDPFVYSMATLSNCIISGNSGGAGGGIETDRGGMAAITNCTISGNSAYRGGGLYSSGGPTTLTNVTLSGNFANYLGGGMEQFGGSTTLTNCTISGNSTDGSGGGVYAGFGTAALADCTVSGNSAASEGGGLYNSSGPFGAGGTVTIGNTIVAGNTTANGDPDVSGTFDSQGNNLIGATDGSSGWVGSDLTGTVAQPLNPLLAPLANYGGPTNTMALLPGSPAINAGNNALIPAGITTDQRGFNRIAGGTVDIGAFESQPIPLVVNTTADGIDVPPGKLSLRGAIDLADILGGNQTITFDPTVFATPQTITLTEGELELSDTTGSETIIGPAAGVTISGGGLSRVFDVDGGVTAILSGLIISGGSTTGYGGGIYNNGSTTLSGCTVSGNSAAAGGGLFSTKRGTVTITGCAIAGNSGGMGGGVYNDGGGATLTDSTVSGNTAAAGGGVFSTKRGTVTITGCTFSGDSAVAGGAIYNDATLNVYACTIAANTAATGGGIDNAADGVATLEDTIVATNTGAGNSPNDIGGANAAAVVGIYDLVGTGGSGGIAGGTGDIILTNLANVGLAPLGNYGGPTETMPLLPDSPAVGEGTSIAGVTTDQRGFAFGANPDIGAFEGNLLIVNTAIDGTSSPSGDLSLRQAINLANVLPGAQTITFDPTVFASAQTITLTQGELELSNTSGIVTIAGSAAGVTISGADDSGVFEVDSGVTATLSGLTISDGKTADNGGGLENFGTVTITDCTISGNFAAGDGGGVDNQGSATLTNCTVSGNSAINNGGGLNNDGDGTMTLTACTISGNSAASGGGLYNLGTASLTDTIVAGNSAPAGAGDIGGSSDDLVTGTYNLIGTGGAGGIIGGIDGNIVLTSLAKLGLASLGAYGGPTETMALLSGSAAIGAGTAVSGLTTDQRGEPLDSPPDIGAFQRQSGSLMVSSISTGEPGDLKTPVASVTVTLSEPAAVGSFGLSALTLTRNHGTNLITSAVSVTLVSGSTYMISGLTNRTGTEGTYTLTVNAADIHDVYGNPGTGSASTSWLMDTTPPTSTVDSLPAQTTSTSFVVSVTASDPKAANGSTASGVASIAIYDSTNGGSFALFTTVSSADPAATFLGDAGDTYAFYSIATDNAGNVQSTPAAAQQTIQIISPMTVDSIAAVAPNPRDAPVSSLDVTFSLPINTNSLTTGALNLTDNGQSISTAGASLSLVSGDTYQINGLAPLTTAEGTYILTVNAADIQDIFGNPGAGSASTSWLMDTTAPTSAVNALPSQTTSASFVVAVTAIDPTGANGSMPSGVASIAIYDAINGGSFALFTTVTTADPSATFTGQAGNAYAFYSIATDQAGNVQPAPTAAQQTVKILAPMTVSSVAAVAPNPRNTSISSLDATFSTPINTSSLTPGALILTENGQSISTAGASITQVSGDTYQINGLAPLTTTEGTYALTVNAADIHDANGNPGTGSVSTSWLMDTTPPTSTVSSLPAQTSSTTFTVSVTATDPSGPDGSTPSEVASIAIYDSTNGGPFTLFTTVTPSDPPATFTGRAGNTYAFYSIATDRAGNVQPVPTEPQATITVANTSAPTATAIIGEQPLFERKLKKGKPVGKPLLTGFTLDFGVPLNSTAASNPADYQVDTVSTKKVKKKVEHLLRPITNFTVTYTAASDAVMIAFAGKETFPTGGQITVLGGLTTASGSTLSGPAVYAISKGGKSIGLS